MTRKTLIPWTLLALALPTIAAAAPKKKAKARAQATETVGRDEHVAGCVTMLEKSYQCREIFIDAMMRLRASHHSPDIPQDQWAAAREIGLRELAEEGSGPLEERRARCAANVDGGQMPRITRADADQMNACLAKTSCDERVACMMPVLERTMFPQ
jgi:hypothetical protein